MARRPFTSSERFSVFTTHGEQCYMCGRLLTMKSCAVDHVIPQSLKDEPEKLKQALADLGLPEDFNIDSYENWLPSCSQCNGLKRDKVWRLTPVIQLWIDKAQAKAAEARDFEAKFARERNAEPAFAYLEMMDEEGQLTDEMKERLRPLVTVQTAVREEQKSTDPIRLAKNYTVELHTVMSDDGHIKVVQGPYGVGGGPSALPANWNMRCGSCGHQFFNGARCVTCGAMDDGD